MGGSRDGSPVNECLPETDWHASDSPLLSLESGPVPEMIDHPFHAAVASSSSGQLHALHAQTPTAEGTGPPGPSISPTVTQYRIPSTFPLTPIQATSVEFPAYPYNPSNVLDNMLPRGLLYKLLQLHFEYVYPLTPLLHWPTFLRDVDERREDRDGEDEWVSLVLSVVAVTICQLPHPLVPIPRDQARSLAKRCYRHVRGWQVRELDGCSVNRGVLPACLMLTTATMLIL